MWKVIGKHAGGKPSFYRVTDHEFVSTPLDGDVVELDTGEWAIVQIRNGEVCLITEESLTRNSLESDSYRNQ